MNSLPDFTMALIARGLLSERDRDELPPSLAGDPHALLQHLQRQGSAGRAELGRAWGDMLGKAYLDMQTTLFQPDTVRLLPADYARRNDIIFVYSMGDVITAAMARPTDEALVRKTELLVGKKISPVFAFPEDIQWAIEVQYQSSTRISDLLEHIPLKNLDSREEITAEYLLQAAGNQAVIELVQSILLLGVKERASDIHFESDERLLRVRFRIDGVLQERMKFEKTLEPPVISRLKIMANMDITEKRRPQDGRIKLQFASHGIDFRFSSIPTIYGEKVVLRILGQMHTRDIPDLRDLHLSGKILSRIHRIIESPNGVFIVTGPTGSGKTTTLYSILKSMNKPGVNIMTVEDPVEYRLAGTNQVQVNPDIGLDFSAGLRSFLRQDPDIILVGEVRDGESARIALQAALTGHMVLTTMHTNGAIQSVTRLADIGVEPFLIAPAIIGVLFQRLVRKICVSCKTAYAPDPEEIDRCFIREGNTPVTFFRGKGCEACNYTGYHGRIAVHELFILDEDIRQMISRNASSTEIRKYALDSGFKPLRHDGLKKVLRGLTTIEEIDKISLTVD